MGWRCALPEALSAFLLQQWRLLHSRTSSAPAEQHTSRVVLY